MLKRRVNLKFSLADIFLRDSEAGQKTLLLLHIYCLMANNYSSAPEPNKQNPRDRTLALPIFFCHKHLTLLKTSLRPHQARVSRTGFRPTLRLCLFSIFV